MSKSVVITVPADALAPNGARTSAATVMTMFRSCIYMGPALVGPNMIWIYHCIKAEKKNPSLAASQNYL